MITMQHEHQSGLTALNGGLVRRRATRSTVGRLQDRRRPAVAEPPGRALPALRPPFAGSIAKRMRLRDRRTPWARSWAALVESIVPNYDGRDNFYQWARLCIRRKLISQQRAEGTSNPEGCTLNPWIASYLAKTITFGLN